MALTDQYAGHDKQEAEIKRQDDLLHVCIWKGPLSFLLEGFIAQHRNAYVSMQQCAEHVEYQLPSQHTHMGYLLEGIQCPDPGLQVAMASVCTDNGPQGMHNNFEATAALLLPYDAVIKKQAASTKCLAAQISALEGDSAEIADTIGKKPSIRKSGVHLCHHMNLEYHELTVEQKSSYFKCSKSGKNTKGELKGCPNNKFPNHKQISTLVSKKYQEGHPLINSQTGKE